MLERPALVGERCALRASVGVEQDDTEGQGAAPDRLDEDAPKWRDADAASQEDGWPVGMDVIMITTRLRDTAFKHVLQQVPLGSG